MASGSKQCPQCLTHREQTLQKHKNGGSNIHRGKTAGNTDGTNQGKQDKRNRKTQIIQTKKAREYKHKQKTKQDFKNKAVNAEWRLEGGITLLTFPGSVDWREELVC